MTVNAALSSSARNDGGKILTFVVPAPDGCNLACPFCYVKQRGEDQVDAMLQPSDYSRFIREVASQHPIGAVCIQGYEPLLEASFRYTRAILATGLMHSSSTSLVTNGTNLERLTDQLKVLRPTRIAVSLDASTAGPHDRQRRKVGAWAATVRGLQAAVDRLGDESELVVASVLLPKRRLQLEGMPSLLKKIGIRTWVVTALQKVGRASVGGPVATRARVAEDIKVLDVQAKHHGIDLALDDEFRSFGNLDETSSTNLRVQRLVRPAGVYRMVPDGRCSRGHELLQELSDNTRKWHPGQVHAAAFLQSL